MLHPEHAPSGCWQTAEHGADTQGSCPKTYMRQFPTRCNLWHNNCCTSFFMLVLVLLKARSQSCNIDRGGGLLLRQTSDSTIDRMENYQRSRADCIWRCQWLVWADGGVRLGVCWHCHDLSQLATKEIWRLMLASRRIRLGIMQTRTTRR